MTEPTTKAGRALAKLLTPLHSLWATWVADVEAEAREQARQSNDRLREAARDVLLHDGSGVGRKDEWAGDFDAFDVAKARDRLRAALASHPET